MRITLPNATAEQVGCSFVMTIDHRIPRKIKKRLKWMSTHFDPRDVLLTIANRLGDVEAINQHE